MRKLLIFLSIISVNTLNAQDLLNELDASNEKVFTTATFKATRLINGHTIETAGKGVLDVKFSHRFGTLNRGAYELWGLDNATMRMGADYGITDRLDIGLGRSTFEKTYDGFIKYKLTKQAKGAKAWPVSIVYIAGAARKTIKLPGSIYEADPSTRFSYMHQVLVARKMNSSLSLQLMPTLVHRNAVPLPTDNNDLLSIGVGGRMKLTRRVSVNAEYYYQVNALAGKRNPLSVGVDIETGGHVFQLHLTNTRGMVEPSFINNTDGSWGNGDILFGFNISRVFTVVKPKG
jgi:hypothetical protein